MPRVTIRAKGFDAAAQPNVKLIPRCAAYCSSRCVDETRVRFSATQERWRGIGVWSEATIGCTSAVGISRSDAASIPALLAARFGAWHTRILVVHEQWRACGCSAHVAQGICPAEQICRKPRVSNAFAD